MGSASGRRGVVRASRWADEADHQRRGQTRPRDSGPSLRRHGRATVSRQRTPRADPRALTWRWPMRRCWDSATVTRRPSPMSRASPTGRSGLAPPRCPARRRPSAGILARRPEARCSASLPPLRSSARKPTAHRQSAEGSVRDPRRDGLPRTSSACFESRRSCSRRRLESRRRRTKCAVGAWRTTAVQRPFRSVRALALSDESRSWCRGT